MREIKFRGLRMDGKGWAYGTYIPAENGKTYISEKLHGEPYAVMQVVDADTVGQFTGLNDKDGLGIYEGDLVEHDMEVNGMYETYGPSKVVYDDDEAMYCFEWDAPNRLPDYENLNVVGNLWDNPESQVPQ